MPIYAYQCQACGHQLEALQKMSDAPLSMCPACQAPQLQKQVTAAAFRLGGGGWYETDFKSGNKKNLADSASTAPAAPAPTTPAPAPAPASSSTSSTSTS